jgi:hypothetical protein
MPLFILIVVGVVLLVIWWSSGNRALNRNERFYLKRRGYAIEDSLASGSPVTEDSRLFMTIESLHDLSPASRQRAAQELARMCDQGVRDRLVFSALCEALNDSDAAVRNAVVNALEKFGDVQAIEHLEKRLEVEEALQTRAALQRAINKLQA